MQLESVDGTRFEFTPIAYQFPALRRRDARAWEFDANWLVVRGKLDLPDGRSHAFEDPCLLVGEALGLSAWLDVVAISAFRGDLEDGYDYAPMEPCLYFRYEGTSGRLVAIRLYLSAEAESPFVVAGRSGNQQNYTLMKLAPEALQAAADEWRQELSAFPPR